jgi:hypothetical protein
MFHVFVYFYADSPLYYTAESQEEAEALAAKLFDGLNVAGNPVSGLRPQLVSAYEEHDDGYVDFLVAYAWVRESSLREKKWQSVEWESLNRTAPMVKSDRFGQRKAVMLTTSAAVKKALKNFGI